MLNNNNQENYQFFGGDNLVLNLSKGDSVDIIDVEGNQPCTVFAFDQQMKADITTIGLVDDNQVKDFDANEQLQTLIHKYEVNANTLQSNSLFTPNNPAGSLANFKAAQDALCFLSAFANDKMQVDKQDPATVLQVNVARKKISKNQQTTLPKPLAKPIKEILINNSTAVSYTVKAGEYIQIIDVEGHQCSDLQVFDKKDIENKQALGIDPTVTRTFVSTSYPHPGVHNKFYNQDSKPLLKIIQDRVSRHDTFTLSCNAKYYDDRGYFGHINCTDNINKALKDYGIKPKLNWVTVNLFFNTLVEECHTISSDVSWSRAGDYVLFKALTDLVCVTSACPDDTTPANNWQPTDIHVRLYDKNNNFPQAIAFRPTPEAIPIMTKETGFHIQTAKHTRNFIEYNGYWLAQDYTNYGAINEYWACRKSAVVMDLSPLRKFEIYGQDAQDLMQLALTRDVRRLAIGQVVYTGICYENGCMIDDGTLFRLCENNFRWICGSDYSGIWLRELAQKNNMQVWVKSSTDQLHNIAVQGPKSRDILGKIIWTNKTQATIDELKWFRFSIARIHSEKGIPIMVSRTGYTGELGYEVFCHPKDAKAVWQEVWDAGKEYNLTPLGLDALDMLRIESGLVFAGYEFDDTIDPFEAGIGFTVPLKSKQENFIGKDALIKRKENPQQALVGLEIHSNEVANHGDCVHIGRQQIGVITSGTRSPILNKNIALCRLSATSSAVGTKVEIGKLDGHQKRIPAVIVNFPFYDPTKSRVRA